MPSHRERPLAGGRRLRLLVLLVLGAGCAAQPEALQAPGPGEWRPFEGTWTAAGTRRTLHLGPDHQASTIDLAGSVLLVGQRGLGVGFRAEVIGLSDLPGGFIGRCVWTDERGDQVFSELKGEVVGSGNRVAAAIVGGTGRWSGITGEYEFRWQYVIENEDGSVSGRATGLKGRARLGAVASTPSTGGTGR